MCENSERAVYNTRPEGVAGETENEIYDILEKLGIEFSRLDRIDGDTENEDVYKILGIRHLKNLLLCNAQKTNFYLLVMPADVPFKSSVLSKQLGTSRFSFAPEESLLEYLHAKSGTSSILGLMFDKNHNVKLVVDERILEDETFGCLPCSNSASLRFKRDDILKKFIAFTGHEYTVVRM